MYCSVAMAALCLALTVGAQAQTRFKPTSVNFKPGPTTSNPQNPFDQVGPLHNEGLIEVGNGFQWERTPTVTPELVFDQSGQFLENRQVIQNFAATRQTNMRTRIITRTRSTDVVAMLQGMGVSSSSTQYVKQTMDLLGSPAIKSVADMTDQFKKIESAVMNNSNLAQNDRDILLSSLAVGRYSIDFWTSMVSTYPTAFGLSASSTSDELFAKAKSVAEEDVKGGLKGGYTGGAISAVTGGGIIVGIAAGVALGAIAGSALGYFGI